MRIPVIAVQHSEIVPYFHLETSRYDAAPGQGRAASHEELHEGVLRYAGQSPRGHVERPMGAIGHADERDCAANV